MKLVGISIYGEIKTHIPHTTGNYATLCGLDGDDPHIAIKQSAAEAGPVVNCEDCIAIWKLARKIKPSQIAA